MKLLYFLLFFTLSACAQKNIGEIFLESRSEEKVNTNIFLGNVTSINTVNNESEIIIWYDHIDFDSGFLHFSYKKSDSDGNKLYSLSGADKNDLYIYLKNESRIEFKEVVPKGDYIIYKILFSNVN